MTQMNLYDLARKKLSQARVKTQWKICVIMHVTHESM